ncbi:hypothetical protein [Alkalilacustris brevis]|uniref:hypothetical protein n=1 Tax=Alkalilacustris brevis TaxID=2026338 RepID=UPI000E0E026D|nr:hypothetical protein [Alkalilacustris brevis]
MPKENQSELFIRSLTEAIEADRLINRAIRALRSKERTERFMELFWSDLNNAMRTLDPVDRVPHRGAAKTQDLRVN